MKYNITEVTWTLFKLAVSHEKKPYWLVALGAIFTNSRDAMSPNSFFPNSYF